MTISATVLIVYRGDDELDAWIEALSDSVATRRISLGHGPSSARATASGAA